MTDARTDLLTRTKQLEAVATGYQRRALAAEHQVLSLVEKHEEAEVSRRALTAAFDEYGYHLPHCREERVNRNESLTFCVCGYKEARAALSPSPTDREDAG